MKTKPALTLEQIGELDGARFDRELRRSVRDAWKSAAAEKRLAVQLGIAGVFAASSGRSMRGALQGEFFNGDTIPECWSMSEWLRARLNHKTETQSLAVVLIDIEQAFTQNGIPAVISHEIGHYLDSLANRYQERKPRQSFIDAFKRAGFHEYSDTPSNQFSELIAETLGQYLRGHNLNAVLLAEVRKVLSKLTRRQQRIIQSFRNKQRQENERTD